MATRNLGFLVLALLSAASSAMAAPAISGPAKATAGTIRKLYGSNVGENAVHGSDSAENAKIEIAYFFPASEVAPTA